MRPSLIKKSILLLAFLLLPRLALAQNAWLVADQCVPIGQTISSTVMDFAAACGNSWKGSELLWQNMQQLSTPAPAETGAESSCPLTEAGSNLAVSIHDPTFVGLPGHAGSHWLMTGTSFLSTTAAAAPFANGWGKTTGGKAFTFVITMKYVSTGVAQAIMATKDPGCTAGNYRGVVLFVGSNGKINFSQCGDTAAVTVTSSAALVDGHYYLIAVGHSGTDTKLWIGSSTSEDFAQTFNATSTDPAGIMGIGGFSDGTSSLIANGTLIYDAQTFNAQLTDSQVAADLVILNARNGVNFGT